MKRIPVRSSNIVSVGYDIDSSVLEVEFGNGIYQYDDVPEDIYDGLMNASSKGNYFHQHIKNEYHYREVR